MNISKKILSLHPVIVIGFAAAVLIGLGAMLFSGIDTSRARSFTVSGPYVFSNYTEWPSSSAPKHIDSMRWYLEQLQLSAIPDNRRVETSTEHIDINGDGLIDLLYFYKCPSTCSDRFGGILEEKMWDYLVLLNKGDLSFDVKYICRRNGDDWYGDCADI